MGNAPICVACELEMRPLKNGCIVNEMANFGSYRLVMADSWKCPGCEFVVVVGRALNALVEHYQPGYADRIAREKQLVGEHNFHRAWSSVAEKLECFRQYAAKL
jgi:hypothetical protein